MTQSTTIANLKDRSTNGLKAAIKRLETSRDQYQKDLAEVEDKLKVTEAAMQAMHKKYKRYGTESQCVGTKLLCSVMIQDLSFITKTINHPATDLL
jgi:septal ring factor EnvC (AmiA/AmiB activator)